MTGAESTLTFVDPFASVTPLTVSWADTTLGKDASVATVKIEADCAWDPSPAYDPLPHPAMTVNGSNSKRSWTHFDILISISFSYLLQKRRVAHSVPDYPLQISTRVERRSCGGERAKSR
jgi:hypothetical protein